MNTFLWFFLIMGIFEVGGATAYLVTGVWPARSRASVAMSLVLWLAIAAWAGCLLSA